MTQQRTPAPWAIGEYWSSSRPHRKVLVLSQGEADILMDGSHHSFIRWVFKSEHADLLQKQRDELLAALEKMNRAYVILMESARDRICDLGGECDGIEVMERNDPYLRESRAAIARVKGEQ